MNMQSICRGAARLVLIGVLGLLVDETAIAQDADAGKKAFAQCSVCHSTDGTNGVGPTLQGIVGSKAGEVPGFRFSRAMKASNILWDDKSLDTYLADPQKTIPGNVMPFSGIADAKERADLIAYLKTLK
jgi:cytochrome c